MKQIVVKLPYRTKAFAKLRKKQLTNKSLCICSPVLSSILLLLDGALKKLGILYVHVYLSETRYKLYSSTSRK